MARHYFSEQARAKYELCVIAGNTALAMPLGVKKSPKSTGKGKQQRKRGNAQYEAQRLSMLAMVGIALNGNKRNGTLGLYQKLPHVTEEFYRTELDTRFNLMERFERCSAADLSNQELHQLLLWFASLGWEKKAGKQRKGAPNALRSDAGLNREALLEKIEAMLAEKGQAEGTGVPWSYAVAILKRQSGGVTKSLDQADRKQLEGVIAALWRDAKRKGRKVR